MKLLQFSISIFLLLLLHSCAETQVDNNVRVLILGRVVDGDSNPIENATIHVYTEADGLGASRVLLAEGISGTFGDFKITSLFGSNSRFYIEVTNGFEYANYTYTTNTSEYRPEDLTFNLQNVVLNKLSRFTYNITRESVAGTTLDFRFRYTDPFCREFFIDGELDAAQSYCFEERLTGRILSDDLPDAINREFATAFNSTIIFTYKINDGIEQEEVINVNLEDYDFSFSY
ncbi:hypothetical protein DFQ05_2518 [Winogradskyella wandonensis]|uniref:Carboxypeptidase family protein n=1 Tax=Winogradskyella wandonensis TaxID=1442586 RepID=A0A4V2PT16_9FLAO|nr:carboxypeptidase-like regulatory domain-containing protein [Winogradskyella wandonensis]TCK64781.1 hypothetical protein DFQ05_2518 [Winogradskyella wandonensis]